ncbi:hypothetical protein Hanom_Chr03g00185051 [Helianthus anomalus]
MVMYVQTINLSPLLEFRRLLEAQMMILSCLGNLSKKLRFESSIHGNNNGIGDLDPACSVKVSWDESAAGERQPRVSLWEIESLTTFPMYPSFFPLCLKRPWYPGPSSFQVARIQRLANTRLVKIFSRRNHFGNLHVMVIANTMFFQTLYFNIIRKSGLCFSVHNYVGLRSLNLGICPKLNALKIEAPSMVLLELKGCGVISEAFINCPLLTSLDASFCRSLNSSFIPHIHLLKYNKLIRC